jgi:hypothetical protein
LEKPILLVSHAGFNQRSEGMMGSAAKALIAILLAWQWAGVTSSCAASAYPERAIRPRRWFSSRRQF